MATCRLLQGRSGGLVLKKSIIIERPHDLIPGLRDVNAELEKHGVVLQIEVDKDQEEGTLFWKDCYLMPVADASIPALFRNRDPIAASDRRVDKLRTIALALLDEMAEGPYDAAALEKARAEIAKI